MVEVVLVPLGAFVLIGAGGVLPLWAAELVGDGWPEGVDGFRGCGW